MKVKNRTFTISMKIKILVSLLMGGIFLIFTSHPHHCDSCGRHVDPPQAHWEVHPLCGHGYWTCDSSHLIKVGKQYFHKGCEPPRWDYSRSDPQAGQGQVPNLSPYRHATTSPC